MVRKEGKVIRPVALLSVFAVFLVIVFLRSDSLYAYIYNGSTVGHVSSVLGSISQVGLTGSGVSAFGSHISNDTIGTESMYITVWGQLGIIGVLLYILMMIMPIIFIIRHRNQVDDETNKLAVVIVFSGIIYGLTGALSEQLSAFTSIAQYFVICGFVCGYTATNRKSLRLYAGSSHQVVSMKESS